MRPLFPEGQQQKPAASGRRESCRGGPGWGHILEDVASRPAPHPTPPKPFPLRELVSGTLRFWCGIPPHPNLALDTEGAGRRVMLSFSPFSDTEEAETEQQEEHGTFFAHGLGSLRSWGWALG